MNRDQKHEIVRELAERIKEADYNFYVTELGGMSVNQTNQLRKVCHENGIHLQMVKNKLIVKALAELNINDSALLKVLKGDSSIMIASNMKTPAEVLKKLSRSMKKLKMKGAYLQHSSYVGEDKLETVLALKSKEDVLGDIISALLAPAQNVISALQTPARNLASILSQEGEGTLAEMAKKDNKAA